MCGIVGIFDTQAQRPVDRGLVEAMNELQLHRGPDGFGYHFEPGVGFGHRRLSIIDLSAGQQPMFNEDGTVCVTYNGEIYNFPELFDTLRKLGHQFKTRCDTEVIVHAWEEWGPACVDRFNGMFAFALWDANQQQFFLVRDRLGIKPLFYSVSPDGLLYFASELKSLLVLADLDREMDPQAIEDYFTFGYVPEPRTIYGSVKKLEPGAALLVTRGKPVPQPRRYWDVSFAARAGEGAIDQADIEAELRERFQHSVQQMMVSDVPLGAFLSGGVDSSAVVAMMSALSQEPVKTCAIGFSEPRYDESAYAAQVAELKQTDHHQKVVEAADYSLLERLIGIYDEPYADSSSIPTYRVCGLAKEKVTVALSGDGGDENFAGYRRYRLFMAEEAVRSRIPMGMRRAIFGPLGRYYPKLDWAPRFVRGKTTFQALARDSVAAYLHGVSYLGEELRVQMYSDTFKRQLAGYRSIEVFRRHMENCPADDALSQVQYLDFKTYLPGDILTKVDRASMAHSLEVRVPFLDHEFVDWVSGIPARLKLKGGDGKHILKSSLADTLPREILYRTKMGFAVPLSAWFRESLIPEIERVVSSDRLERTGIFDMAFLQRLAHEHTTGRRDHGSILWALLMFEGFLRHSMEPASG